ncbi:hypothetical protein VW29_04610 [Devosia limi DSM 17137]|uniref:Flp pilus assembly protein TadG n=1 Tax=Devosia limi DSM 17137 TaxID=1121477 RepID=A0A0F5LUJ3_9HYPH|nr:TadE/TadG family type IV pilus assembly protein [Devosia limi]KKB86020.1 hypothetical protein VW29_04610 [Devosia limi DSM 17137]SHG00490.1 Flp pilus assembly protein TadG [Devosia limi DSM 17137]
MRGFVRLLEQFRSDERGVFAIMFGLIAVVLIAVGGATVDFVSLEQTRNRAQAALDAAALALQPEIFNTKTTTDAIRTKAEALLLDRIGGGDVIASISDIRVDTETGSLFLQAQMTMPTLFVRLVGVEQMNAVISTQATRRRLKMEIVMALDNSGSMLQESRMTYLKQAAECATYILMYDEVVHDTKDTCKPAPGAELLEDVRIGIVPFTMYVNVGKGNASQPWIDQLGISPTANDNFDDDDNDATPFTGMVDRLALYDGITNDSWRGCVEARPHVQSGGPTEFYDTDDFTPVPPNLPDRGVPESLFVPLFAPDLSESTASLSGSTLLNNYTNDHPPSCNVTGECTWTETRRTCSSYSSCSGSTSNKYSLDGPHNGNLSCTCSNTASTWKTDVITSTGSGSRKTFTRVRTCDVSYKAQGLTPRELQERLCKYNGATLNYTSGQKGPNVDCPAQALLPLNDNPTTVVNTIKAMVADGGTNIHEGTAWGYRVLSPTSPFIEGGPYDEATNKVLIVMTDGENTAYHQAGNKATELNGSEYHSAYAFPFNQRLGTMGSNKDALVAEMNQRTIDTCANAKARKGSNPGLTIYTIGLATDKVSQSPVSVVKAMLSSCASDPNKARFPPAPSDLKAVFQGIADELAALRLDQ